MENTANDTTDRYSTKQAQRRSRKRALEQDTLPDAMDHERDTFSGRERDTYLPRDMIPRSASPTNNARRTRTGRVSKAAKGIPVHHCDCGKTYTRAEHLRRHQQNHEPGAFLCDFLRCDRTFSREDLLSRHRAKHNDNSDLSEASMPMTAQPSPGLHGASRSFSSASSGTSKEARVHTGSSSHRSSQSSGATVRKGFQPIAELHPPNPITDAGTPYLGATGRSIWDTSLHSQQSELSPLTLDTNPTWTTSSISLGASRSPISPDSIAPTSTWRWPSPAYVQLRTPASDHSASLTYSDTDTSRNSSFGQLPATGGGLLPEDRDRLEQNELMTPTTAPQNFGARQYHHCVDNEQRYLQAYWRLVHPIWPIIHKPTFDMSYASPLLWSAMLAMGACLTGDQIDAANACILHKRCLKVIKSRTVNNWHSYRICDMQAILMVELFATYKSRRPPLQSSKPFQDSYCTLARDCDVDTTGALFTDFETLDFSQELPTVTLECESRQRLLAAYYILDQEQATLFGRHITDVPGFIPATLGLPQPLYIWDSNHALGWSPYDHLGGWYFEGRGNLGQGTTSAFTEGPVDVFVATLALVYTSDTRGDHPLGPQNVLPDHDLYTTISNSPHVDLARQTFALCNSVPTRALLAVAGESWVMAEKLSLYTEYKGAQETVRLWTSTSASKAFGHALEVLRLHKLYSKTACPYHEWSLHLASLVVWVCTYVRRPPNMPLRLSIPLSTNAEPVIQEHELDRAFTNLAQAGTDGLLRWEDTKYVLTWAKSRIEKTGSVRFSGVVSGAVDVLKALIARGEEDGWF